MTHLFGEYVDLLTSSIGAWFVLRTLVRGPSIAWWLARMFFRDSHLGPNPFQVKFVRVWPSPEIGVLVNNSPFKALLGSIRIVSSRKRSVAKPKEQEPCEDRLEIWQGRLIRTQTSCKTLLRVVMIVSGLTDKLYTGNINQMF